MRPTPASQKGTYLTLTVTLTAPLIAILAATLTATLTATMIKQPRQKDALQIEAGTISPQQTTHPPASEAEKFQESQGHIMQWHCGGNCSGKMWLQQLVQFRASFVYHRAPW